MNRQTNTYFMRRKWREHPAFDGETYSRMDAWGWIIENAAWKDGVVNVNGNPIPLTRGQLSFSIRFMAEKWKWGKSSVERFLKHLKKWDMIGAESGTGLMLITVCNYDKYQHSGEEGRDTSGTPTETQAGQGRDKEEERNKKRTKKGKEILEAQKPDCVSESVWRDFLTHRKTKNASVTETVLDGIAKEAVKAGWTLEAALTECCARGWQGFKADWVDKKTVQPSRFSDPNPYHVGIFG